MQFTSCHHYERRLHKTSKQFLRRNAKPFASSECIPYGRNVINPLMSFAAHGHDSLNWIIMRPIPILIITKSFK